MKILPIGLLLLLLSCQHMGQKNKLSSSNLPSSGFHRPLSFRADPEMDYGFQTTAWNEPVLAEPDLGKYARMFARPAQTITLNNQNDTSLVLLQGTVLRIPAHGFEVNGVAVDEKIDLVAEEYYQTSDVLLKGLSTRSGDEMLETGGMINLRVYCKGHRCTLKPGKKIEIGFPLPPDKAEGMQLFLGEQSEGGINWKALSEIENPGEPSVTKPIVDYVLTESESKKLNTYAYHYLRYPPSLRDTKTAGYVGLRITTSTSGFPENICVTRSLEPLLDRAVVDLIINIPFPITTPGTRCQINTHLDVNAKRDNLYDRSVVNDALLQSHFEKMTIRYCQPPPVFGSEEYMRNLTLKVKTGGIDSLSGMEMGLFFATTTRLGWINCDRFLNDTRPKTSLTVQTEKGKDPNGVFLVFHSSRSILCPVLIGNELVFSNVPIGEKTSLVAFRNENNRMHFYRKDGFITPGEPISMKLQPLTKEEFKTELLQINQIHRSI